MWALQLSGTSHFFVWNLIKFIEVLEVSKEVVFILSFMQPMFEFVKFQPDLVTETRKSELGRDR